MFKSKPRKVLKPTPAELFIEPEQGEGTNFEIRLAGLLGYLTPIDRFYICSHAPTPHIDAKQWQLRIDGSGVRQSTTLSYDELRAMPQTSVTRMVECAGNGRVFFKQYFGREIEGTQWRTGAIGVAEWTGVRLRDVLARAELTRAACSVMPEGLDELRFARPLPLTKAMADDTIVALVMNGEVLPPDHGYPARVIVSGWLGAASVKWIGRIQVAEEPLYSKWNTEDYTMAGPDYAREEPADGAPITTMPVMSVLDLDWPATLSPGTQVIRGRDFSGEGRISRVEYKIDNGSWRQARLCEPNIAGAWVRWEFDWRAEPGEREIRVRATDEQGHRQPDKMLWNDHGCQYNAVSPIR